MVALALAGAASSTVTFQMTDLGALGAGSSSANAISPSGQVVGVSGPAAFSWTPCTGMIPIGNLGGASDSALAVNDAGQSVGFSATAAGPFHAFSWTLGGGTIDLGTFGGAFSLAHAVNAAGEVVGWAENATAQHRAFRWSSAGGGLHDLGTLGGSIAEAQAVNDSGVVVGNSLTTNNAEEHAAAWSPTDQITDLGTLAGSFTKSDALAVNDNGEVVGSSAVPGTSIRHAVAWTGGAPVDLGLVPGGVYSEAVAVNDSGQIAGYGDASDHQEHAIFWNTADGNAITDLGVGQAFAINASGQVAGGSPGAFSWTAADGRIDLGGSVADAVNDNGQVAGASGGHAALWEYQASPSAFCPPTHVVAAAGDASASVAWVAPSSDGGTPVTSYTVTADPGGATTTVDGSTTSTTVAGLANGTSYSFTVTPANANGPGPTSAPSNQVTPQAGNAAASGEASPSSATTVSTGGDPATTGGTATSVTVPSGTAGGPVSVSQTGASEPTPSGYVLGGVQIDISAPAATATNPLALVFTFAPASGQTPDNAEIYRAEGVGPPTLVADCSGPAGQAVPDPCVSSRQSVSIGDISYIQLTVLSSTASHWNTARPKAGAVTVGDAGYTPQTIAVQPGATVNWAFIGKKPHTVTDAELLGTGNSPWFNSGSRSAGNFSFGFPAAGGFRYSSTVKSDSLSGAVLVPDLVTPGGGGTATTFGVVWSTKALSGYVFDVQYRFRPPKSTGWKGWVSWKPGVATTTATFQPTLGAGTYAFHSRLRNVATGRSSDYSPDATITVS